MRATSATVGNGVSMIVGFDMNRAYSFGTTRSTEANPLANRSVVESHSRSDGSAVKRKSALEYSVASAQDLRSSPCSSTRARTDRTTHCGEEESVDEDRVDGARREMGKLQPARPRDPSEYATAWSGLLPSS